jgi:hypothetical protein
VAIQRLHDHLATAVDVEGRPDEVLRAFARHLLTHLLTPSGRGGANDRGLAWAPVGCFIYVPPAAANWIVQSPQSKVQSLESGVQSHKAEGGSLKGEVGGQKSEVRGQRSEVRGGGAGRGFGGAGSCGGGVLGAVSVRWFRRSAAGHWLRRPPAAQRRAGCHDAQARGHRRADAPARREPEPRQQADPGKRESAHLHRARRLTPGTIPNAQFRASTAWFPPSG